MIGQLVGHYKVVRKIGDGGMGSVFEALHESIGRRVAIKVLKNEYSRDQNLVTRFFNEARAVNIVSHPGIVGSFDYGQLPDGTAYIVMEFLEGESLAARLKRMRGAFGLDSLRIGRQIAAAISAAHNRGIIHRDLKPDNVIIVPDPEAPGGERAKVLDFGIAKIVSENEEKKSANSGLTAIGAVMGTPRYMSPEQCKGSGNVDFKTDVYALGVIMFELLSGKPPFDGEGTGALMAAHIFQEPPLLSERVPGLPQGVVNLVNSMLAKDPAARPTMAQIVGQIEALGAKSTQAMSAVQMSDLSAAFSAGIPAAAIGGEASGPATSSRPSLHGIGQTQDPTKIRAGAPLLKRLALPAAMAVVLSSIGVLFVLRNESKSPIVQVPVPPMKTVTWQVKTKPAGVEIVRVSDGVVLGMSPWKTEQPVGMGKLGVTLRRVGFMDRQVLLDREKDCDETVDMESIPTENKPSVTNAPDVNPAGKKSLGGQPLKPKKKKTESSDDDIPLAPVR